MVTLAQIRELGKKAGHARRHGTRDTKWGPGTLAYTDVALNMHQLEYLEAAMFELRQLRILRNQVLFAEHNDLPTDFMKALIELAHATKTPKAKPGPKPKPGRSSAPTRRGGPPANPTTGRCSACGNLHNPETLVEERRRG